jgi:hypothetical protein
MSVELKFVEEFPGEEETTIMPYSDLILGDYFIWVDNPGSGLRIKNEKGYTYLLSGNTHGDAPPSRPVTLYDVQILAKERK